MSSKKIEILKTFEEMNGNFSLIQQLNPKMTVEKYAKSLQAMVKQGNYYQILCTENGKKLGMTGVWSGTKVWCGKYMEVDNFVVDEAYRGQGVGQLLLKWVEEKAGDENCEMVMLDTYVVLDKAQRFYFSRGYKIEGYHMTKRLNQ